MSLVTRCPACTTLFKVVPDQIRIAAGWVRCGHCGEVFDASAHLLPRAASAPAAPASTPTSNADALHVEWPAATPPPSAATPHTEPGELLARPDALAGPPAEPWQPEPLAEQHTAASPALLPPSAEIAPAAVPAFNPSEDTSSPASAASVLDEQSAVRVNLPSYLRQTESPLPIPPAAAFDIAPNPEPLDAHDLEPVEFGPVELGRTEPGATEPVLLDPPLDTAAQWPAIGLPDDAAPENEPPLEVPPSFVAAARRRAFWGSRPVRALLWFGGAALLLGLAGQWAIGQRDWLAARAPQLAPMLRALCTPLGCTVGPYRQLDAIVIDSSVFNRVMGNQFRFSVSLRNLAQWPVASPSLELTLTDADNQPLLRRVLAPAELGAPPALVARAEFSTSQGVVVTDPVDPGAVAGYRLSAFYP